MTELSWQKNQTYEKWISLTHSINQAEKYLGVDDDAEPVLTKGVYKGEISQAEKRDFGYLKWNV